jgi:hypothetical protein
MTTIISIDPGTVESAYVIWDGTKLIDTGKELNEQVLFFLSHYSDILSFNKVKDTACVIEQIKSYGMVTGESIHETIFWAGRFFEKAQNLGLFADRMPRMDVKMHLCNTSRAKDGNIIQAIKDRFGDKPTKKQANPVYNDKRVADDIWQAWALAITYYDLKK